jgi:hypothetical protein
VIENRNGDGGNGGRKQARTAKTANKYNEGDRFTYDVEPKTEMIDRLAPDGMDNEND